MAGSSRANSSSGARRCSACAVFGKNLVATFAVELLRAGCMWNSFVMVARVSTLISLTLVALPDLLASFSKIYDLLGTAREPSSIERLYERTPAASFSDEVLERYPTYLSVLPVHGIEWSDLGEPQRVMAVLSRLGIHPEWTAA
jgi:mannose-1-phosphate guanylyltransferase